MNELCECAEKIAHNQQNHPLIAVIASCIILIGGIISITAIWRAKISDR